MTGTVSYLLGKLGRHATGRFAARLAPLGLRPRHCGVLELLAPGPRAQLDLADALGVTPAVVVDMLDELERLGAVRRVRDTADRRRHLIELTREGGRLRAQAISLARETDAELLATLDPAVATALRHALQGLATTFLAGISPDQPEAG